MRMAPDARSSWDEAWRMVGAYDLETLRLRKGNAVAARSLMLRQPTSGECELVVCSDAGMQVYGLSQDQVRLLAAKSVPAALNMTACGDACPLG